MTISEMGHPQPRTLIQTDNLAAHAVVTNNVQPRRTKAMDMILHWIRCRDAQGQFRYFWKPGTMNLGDYWTKHHPRSHHKNFRSLVLIPMKDLMQFCARHVASTEREQAQNKTQLTNMNQLKTIKKCWNKHWQVRLQNSNPTARVCQTRESYFPQEWETTRVRSPRSTELWIRCQ